MYFCRLVLMLIGISSNRKQLDLRIQKYYFLIDKIKILL